MSTFQKVSDTLELSTAVCIQRNVSPSSSHLRFDHLSSCRNSHFTQDVYVSITEPAHGTSSFEGSEIRYTPEADFCGEDTFSYTITKASGGLSDTATVTVNVECDNSNSAPIANDDSYSTDQGSSVVLPVLDNDSFSDGEDVSGSFSAPSYGSLEMGASDLVYTPNAEFCGTDAFNYTLVSGNASDTATVTIEVICPEEEEEETVGDSTPDSAVLKAENDFVEGNMNEAIVIPVLANDIMRGGE